MLSLLKLAGIVHIFCRLPPKSSQHLRLSALSILLPPFTLLNLVNTMKGVRQSLEA